MHTITRTMLFAGAAVAAGAIGAPSAAADDGTQHADLGGPVEMAAGDMVQQWTVSELRPSADQINYPTIGALWEATATNAAVQGGHIPVVPGFIARSEQDSYPVLWNVPSPAGVNPAPLNPGAAVTGKLYFDVTGTAPDNVAWAADGRDVAVWLTPPPPPAAEGGTAPMAYGPVPGSETLPAQLAPQTAPAPAAPAAVPAPKAGPSQGTPLPAGTSAGTPLPAGPSAGTPLPAGTSAGTPLPAGTSPLPAGSAGTPITAPAATSPVIVTPTPAAPSTTPAA
jgi:hypothetical protein